MRIGILDDDITSLQMVEQALKEEAAVLGQIECFFFTSGVEMLDAVKKEHFDCLILDRHLPDMSGDVVLLWVKQYGLEKFGRYTSVLLLTSMSTGADEVYGLKMGADDYLVKPFNPSVLVQRINRLYVMNQTVEKIAAARQVLGLSEVKTAVAEQNLSPTTILGYEFNSLQRRVTLPSGESVKLTLMEFDLAYFLFQNEGRRLSRQVIIDALNRDNLLQKSRSLDTHMYNVRAKLRLLPENGFELRPIYGFGYLLHTSHHTN